MLSGIVDRASCSHVRRASQIQRDLSADYGKSVGGGKYKTFTTVFMEYWKTGRLANKVRGLENLTALADTYRKPLSDDEDDDVSDKARGKRRKLDDDRSEGARRRRASGGGGSSSSSSGKAREDDNRKLCPFWEKHQITNRAGDKCRTPAGERCPKGRHGWKAGEYRAADAEFGKNKKKK